MEIIVQALVVEVLLLLAKYAITEIAEWYHVTALEKASLLTS